MQLTHSINENIKALKAALPFGESFDLLERIITIRNKTFYLYFVDGFIKDTNLEYVRRDMSNVDAEVFDQISTASQLIAQCISSVETSTETNLDRIITALLSGQAILFGPHFNEAIIIDLRTYPSRSIDEPNREQVLRGSHDGFVETVIFNSALIRRRIRDPHLIFKMESIGTNSKTDVAVAYMSDRVDEKALTQVLHHLKTVEVKALTMCDQSLVESIHNYSWFNPFPKARYTERPDVAAAHILEGKIVILVDNTPSAIIVPTSLFDFLQSIDDYYMPVLTGNYLRLVRYIILISNLLLTPLFILFTDNPQWFSPRFEFLIPQDPYNLPIALQFLILELSVDGLKIASLNTPSSLGTSLSVIGGLILGDFAVQTGWFIPHTILYMAVVALSSFVQPSIEFSYAIKFSRIILIIATGLFGTWGFIVGLLFDIIFAACTKTFTGSPYLYPLIPFNGKALKHLIFRTHITSELKK